LENADGLNRRNEEYFYLIRKNNSYIKNLI